MGKDVLWLRYVDDVLVVAPKTMDLNAKINELNAVNHKIQFTIELEKQGALPFLDTELVRKDDQIKFKVYRKPTNREDLVHFFSGHSSKVKSGIVLGFFLRGLRICSDEYLTDELQHIISSFMKLKYPKGFLLNLKKKAEAIRKTSEAKRNETKHFRYITIPNSKIGENIANHLETVGVKVAMAGGRRIGDMFGGKRAVNGTNKSVVYQVPCGTCTKSYVGETGRGSK